MGLCRLTVSCSRVFRYRYNSGKFLAEPKAELFLSSSPSVTKLQQFFFALSRVAVGSCNIDKINLCIRTRAAVSQMGDNVCRHNYSHKMQ